MNREKYETTDGKPIETDELRVRFTTRTAARTDGRADARTHARTNRRRRNKTDGSNARLHLAAYVSRPVNLLDC